MLSKSIITYVDDKIMPSMFSKSPANIDFYLDRSINSSHY